MASGKAAQVSSHHRPPHARFGNDIDYSSPSRNYLKIGFVYKQDALKDYHRSLFAVRTDHINELNYYDRKRIHNLKYFTWVEQQGKDMEELNAQWYDCPDYWKRIQSKEKRIDKLIEEFDKKTGFI